MPFKDIPIWSTGGHFVQRRGTNCAILVEGIKGNNSMKLFEFETVVQEEMSFKDISYLEIWRPFCSAEQNHLCNSSREHHEEQFYESISSLGQWFRRRCCLKDFMWSGTIYTIMKKGIIGNIHVKLYEIWTSGSGEDVV